MAQALGDFRVVLACSVSFLAGCIIQRVARGRRMEALPLREEGGSSVQNAAGAAVAAAAAAAAAAAWNAVSAAAPEEKGGSVVQNAAAAATDAASAFVPCMEEASTTASDVAKPPAPSPGYSKRLARKREKMKLCEPSQKLAEVRLDYLDRFLRWECGLMLQELALFPNAKEITESVACLQALEKHGAAPLSEANTLCAVVGDGSTPRTAALLAMRSKWRRVVSVDPALAGLPLPGCEVSAIAPEQSGMAAVQKAGKKRRQNLEAKLDHQRAQEAPRRERLRQQLAGLASVQRLELQALTMEEVQLEVAATDKHIVVVLPHAHVVPNHSLRSFRLSCGARLPSVTVVQLPCCGMKRHTEVCGHSPDVEYQDRCICTPERDVRVWRDVSESAFRLGLLAATPSR